MLSLFPAGIGQRFHVSKYPTLKLVRYGELVKKEYRGQRSVDSISEFIREQLSNPIEVIDNLNAVDNLDVCESVMGGWQEGSVVFIRLALWHILACRVGCFSKLSLLILTTGYSVHEIELNYNFTISRQHRYFMCNYNATNLLTPPRRTLTYFG